jgi:hypothetical protein
MFIETLNRLVYEEGKLIEHPPLGIPEGTTIKIEWDGGRNILQPKTFFGKGGGDFTVSEKISTGYAMSERIESITINGETLDKSKVYHSYIFTVKFENKGPLNSVEYEIIYYPEFFQMGRVQECLSIKYLNDRHKNVGNNRHKNVGNRGMFDTGSRFFTNLKISCPDIKVIRCEQKLALSKLLNERLSERSPIEANLDIITLISEYINNDYYSGNYKWKSWEEVEAAGYGDYEDHGFGGGGTRLRGRKRKSKKKKRATKRRKSKRKKHKTKRRKY